MNIGTRLKNTKFGQGTQSNVSGKGRQILKLSKNLLFKSYNLFWSLSKNWVKSSEWLNVWTRLKNAKFGQRIQNYFSWKVRQTLKILKKFLSILEFPINMFQSLWKPKSCLMRHWLLVQGFIMPNLVNKYKTIFLKKRGWPWNLPTSFFSYWSYLYTRFGVCKMSQWLWLLLFEFCECWTFNCWIFSWG